VLFRRPRKLTPHKRRRDTGDETLIDIACGYNVVSFVGAVRERDWQSITCSGPLAWAHHR
jgi:hypothetical protein